MNARKRLSAIDRQIAELRERKEKLENKIVSLKMEERALEQELVQLAMDPSVPRFIDGTLELADLGERIIVLPGKD